MSQQESDFAEWIGKTSRIAGTIDREHTLAIAATLNLDSAFAERSPLPPLWHWCFLNNPEPQAKLGEDGHPRRGEFLPPISLPRRMWAGSRIQFLQPIKIGAMTEKQSRIASIKQTTGQSGELVFVTVEHEISQAHGFCLREEQDIVFRAAPTEDDPTLKKTANNAAPAQAGFHRDMHADAALLFRYSAVTFNAHRIHYDRTYCTEQEHYPGLVVHGPLLATLLMQLLQQSKPEFNVEQFRFRALAPVFDLTPFRLNASNDKPDEFALWVSNSDNALCLSAVATGTHKR